MTLNWDKVKRFINGTCRTCGKTLPFLNDRYHFGECDTCWNDYFDKRYAEREAEKEKRKETERRIEARLLLSLVAQEAGMGEGKATAQDLYDEVFLQNGPGRLLWISADYFTEIAVRLGVKPFDKETWKETDQ